jgi:hypothetical protein
MHDSLSSALASVSDWDALVERAVNQRMAGYLLGVLAGLPGVPAPALARLQRLSAQTRAQGMRLDLWLERLAGRMQDDGLPLMVLKGPSLARTVYSSATLRPYDDLDILLRPRDEDAAVKILTEWGFSETLDPPEERWARSAGVIPGFAPLHHQFHDPSGEVVVELHTDPLQLGLQPICEAERWRRAQALPGLASCLMLSPEDQLVQLSVHAQKHGYERLIWLKDIDLLLRTQGPTFDWPLCRGTARSEGVSGSVWYSLVLARRLFNTPVAEEQFRLLRPSLPARRLYGHTWPCNDSGVSSKIGCRAIQFTPWESWRGMLPSFFFMGRRAARTRAFVYAGVLTLLKRQSRAAPRRGPVGLQRGLEALRATRLG